MAAVDHVAEKVTNILADHLGVDTVDVVPAATLERDLGADSLDCVEMVMALEEEFGIEIPDADVEKTSTVAEVIVYVEQRLKSKQ